MRAGALPACPRPYPERMAEPTSPLRPTDDEARALARRLLAEARHGALAFRDPDTGRPSVSRVAVATTGDGAPFTLVSDLSAHTRALRADPACALLVGEPGDRGDPLTHPRLTVHATARFVARQGADHATLRDRYLGLHPKARLYIDFADFGFVLLDPSGGSLNGGFGKAYELTAADLTG